MARRAVFHCWAALIGTRAAFGIAQWLRFVLKGDKQATAKFLCSMRGRFEGWRTVRRSSNASRAAINPEEKAGAKEVKPANPDREEVTRTCLEAHQTLMQINPENVSRFKDGQAAAHQSTKSRLAISTTIRPATSTAGVPAIRLFQTGRVGPSLLR